jgi:hypothetical protein
MPVINGVYLKDFAALPGAVDDANIIPIAISGNQVAYRTTVSGIITDARITGKLLTGLSVTGSAVVATDSILTAFGKVQNQINGKQGTITLTTTGTSGASTLVGNTLNIPNYSPDLSGYVTLNTAQTITAAKTFTTSGGSNTLVINHSSGSGIALSITKGGNGEGIYVNKTSGSGNAVTIIGTLNATTLVKNGGTSSQFLKADGSVDSTAYGTGSVTSVAALTLGTTGSDLSSTVANSTTTPVITLNVPDASASNRGVITTGTQTIAGDKTFTGALNGTSGAFIGAISGSAVTITASSGIAADFTNNSSTNETLRARNNGSGNIASFRNLTTEVATITNAGGLTLTGALSGTTATFTGTIQSGVLKGIATSGFGVSGQATSGNAVTGNATTGVGGVFIANGTGGVGLLVDSYTGVIAKFQASGSDKVTISNTGALSGTSATFSSSVTSDDLILTAGTLFGTGNTGFSNRSADGVLYLQMPANGFNITDNALNTKIQISSTGALSGTSATFSGSVKSGTGSVYTELQSDGMYATGTDLYLLAPASKFMSFYTGGSERMRITSGGFTKASNTGTYVGSTSAYHEVRSNENNADCLIVSHTHVTNPQGVFSYFSAAAPNNTNSRFFLAEDNAAKRFEVRANGGIANYSANDVNLSDERVKKDIIPLESYWDKFKAIKIVKFKYKDQIHDDFNIGVIAQQVEAVAPEFVDIDGWDNKPKLDEEGNEIINDEEPLKSIYTADLYHATIKVLQECMSKIEELSAEIDLLRGIEPIEPIVPEVIEPIVEPNVNESETVIE